MGILVGRHMVSPALLDMQSPAADMKPVNHQTQGNAVFKKSHAKSEAMERSFSAQNISADEAPKQKFRSPDRTLRR